MAAPEPSDAESIDDDDVSEVQSGAAERMVFFSDAVVAIAMTLLALELPVPTGASMSEVLAFFQDHRDEYLAFALSFVVIAIHWTSHHRLFRWIFRMDDRLRFLNFCWLFTIVITPFATDLLSVQVQVPPGGTDTSEPLRFALYAVVQVLGDLAFILICRHMQSAGLLRPVVPPHLVRRCITGAAAVGIGFALSIPLFFVDDRAWVLWIVIPLASGTALRVARRRAARR